MEKMTSEQRNAMGLEETLASSMEKHLCVLWKQSKNPITWIVKAAVLAVFLADSISR